MAKSKVTGLQVKVEVPPFSPVEDPRKANPVAVPEYCQLSQQYGEAAGNAAATHAAIVEGVKAALESGVREETIRADLGSYYVAGFAVRALTHQEREWLALDTKAFKALKADKDDAGAVRQRVTKARGLFVSGVLTRAKAGAVSSQGDNSGEGEATEPTEADKAKLIEAARKAYAQACSGADAKIKKARQALQDLGVPVIGEARVTAAFITLRGPMGGEPDAEG